ncbi:family 2 glycosyl transferase [Candidatus Pacearchaeota archaeon]|nr:MAG: family 2 glycosyl transferase [Candidatus Pacearchaeota archaeon]
MENKKETVCAVVVTYNRKKLLLECLEALLKQTRPVQGVYLIDNASTDGTPELLLEKGYIKKLPPENLTEPWEKEFEIKNLIDGQVVKLHYVRMHENTGGAGGFHEGVKRAYEKGYDWLWLMDDDGLSAENTLYSLLDTARKTKIFYVGPLIICKDNREWLFAPFNDMKVEDFFKKFGDNVLIKGKLPTFNGSVVHRKVVKEIGCPDKDLFIWGDEDDYRARTLRAGFEVAVTTSAIYYHPQLFKWKKGKLLWKTFKYEVTSIWKSYYQIRNHTYLTIYKGQRYNFLKDFLKNIVIDIFYRKEKKLIAIKYHIKALFDGIFKRMGRRMDFVV